MTTDEGVQVGPGPIARLCRRMLDLDVLDRRVADAMRAFVHDNALPESSPYLLASLPPDDVDAFVSVVVRVWRCPDSVAEDLLQSSLNILKILCRKDCNRFQFGVRAIGAVVAAMSNSTSMEVLAACANVLMNACHNRSCVDHLVALNGVPGIVQLLECIHAGVVCAAAGVLRSVACERTGRQAILQTRAIPLLVPLLSAPQEGPIPRVCARAIATLHNLTCDHQAIGQLRACSDALRLIAVLLQSPHDIRLRASAAGVVQNIALDEECRRELQGLAVVEHLSALALGTDVDAQAHAIGALWNMSGASKSSDRFKSILADCLVAGALLDDSQ